MPNAAYCCFFGHALVLSAGLLLYIEVVCLFDYYIGLFVIILCFDLISNDAMYVNILVY